MTLVEIDKALAFIEREQRARIGSEADCARARARRMEMERLRQALGAVLAKAQGASKAIRLAQWLARLDDIDRSRIARWEAAQRRPPKPPKSTPEPKRRRRDKGPMATEAGVYPVWRQSKEQESA